MLMCKNAQTFYDASTVFHTDSIKLQKIFGDLKSEFETEDNSGNLMADISLLIL